MFSAAGVMRLLVLLWSAHLALGTFVPGPARPLAIGPVRIVPVDYRAPSGIPPLVFVSRAPSMDGVGVPGLGPGQRAIVTGGRLLVRESSGRIRDLLGNSAPFDVSDPAVSFDGERIAFAAVAHPDSAWRIQVVNVDGRGLRAITRTTGDPRERFDDLDPCWIGADLLCFASTRDAMESQYAPVRATNLFVVSTRIEDAATPPRRITSERNGAEEPAFDPRRGQIVYSRWWFNRFAPPRPPSAAPDDSVNLWHAIALTPEGPRLRCGSVTSRRAMTAYQITFLPDGAAVAVCGLNLGLWPRPGALAIQRFTTSSAPVVRLAGAVLPDSVRGGYPDALGLAAPAACAPAALPDGRVVFSHDPGGRGDFGLWIVRPAFPPAALFDRPGALELDAAPIVRRSLPRAAVPFTFHDRQSPANPVGQGEAGPTFDYLSLGLFKGGREAPGPPTWTPGTRIRFLAAAPRERGPDTTLLIRELAVDADGRVEARGLPADVPLFEQLLGPDGMVLRAAHGPAHVAGFNAGAPGGRSRCVGCHLGHSALPVPAKNPPPADATRGGR